MAQVERHHRTHKIKGDATGRNGGAIFKIVFIMTTLEKRIKNAAICLENIKTRGAWANGVKCYAFDLLSRFEELCSYDENAPEFTEKTLLNGAVNWLQYAEGGCGLCYNSAIAERLCNPTELKRTQGGAKNPNSRENWLQVEARALWQAWRMLRDAWAAA